MTHSWIALGTSVGVVQALREILSVILHGFGLAKETDFLHQARQAEASPGRWIVNFAYHWGHHFLNPQAYLGGKYTLLDQLIGTALSLRGKRVAIMNMGSPLGTALAEGFEQEGAIVTEVTPEVSLDSVDILVLIDAASQHLLLPFLQTVTNNRAIARKECWWVSSSPSQPPFPSSTRKIAPCTIRQILLLAPAETSSEDIVGQILFQAKRHVLEIVVTKDPVIFFLYWLNLLTNQLWLQYTRSYQQSAPL
ncbi:hypothetical protein H6F95_02070 [Cyanobacteria bacterium FACHB-471]|nr:hypothetical protein [Cyanobacteria bacterium FACHB-471]